MSKFKQAINEIKKKREKVIKEIAVFVEGEAKIRTPVDTGHLRRSISHKTKTDEQQSTATIGTNVEYAAAVEYGVVSKNIPAQPYLRPAIDENLGDIKDIINKGLKPWLRAYTNI